MPHIRTCLSLSWTGLWKWFVRLRLRRLPARLRQRSPGRTSPGPLAGDARCWERSTQPYRRSGDPSPNVIVPESVYSSIPAAQDPAGEWPPLLQFSGVTTTRLSMPSHRKSWLVLAALALLVVALNGCGDFFVNDNGSSGGTTGTPKFAYVSNYNSGGAGSISAFTVDSSTGALTAVSGSPFSSGAGNGPVGIVADSAGNFVFVANEGGGVSSFRSIATRERWLALRVHRNGRDHSRWNRRFPGR